MLFCAKFRCRTDLGTRYRPLKIISAVGWGIGEFGRREVATRSIWIDFGTPRSHTVSMKRQFLEFKPELTRGGRWFVAIVTGYGPDSHIGDFETEAEAKEWILTKSKYWPDGPLGRDGNRIDPPAG
jgi:hypothetical protein